MAEAYKLPSRGEHAAFIRKVWRGCLGAALVCFIGMAGTVAVMALLGRDSKAIVNVQLIIVYIVLPVYAIGYVAPTLASSLIKMSLGLEMSRETAAILERVDQTINARVAKLDRVLDGLDKLVRDADEGNHPLVKELRAGIAGARQDLAAIRTRVERDTAPLPAPRRPAAPAVPSLAPYQHDPGIRDGDTG